jgi:nitroreductase
MAARPDPKAVSRLVRTVRQIRQYKPDPLPDGALEILLELARWTGSSKNTQPWHFIVVRGKERLRELSQIRTPINWLAAAPLGIAIVLDGKSSAGEAYDEGRVTERILIGAHNLGLGGGVAWWGDATQQAEAKRILGIPEDRTARSMVMIGHPISSQDPRPTRATGGRKPLSEIVSNEGFGLKA